ncbi:NADP-dependent oxidoreductase domain-containing protein [Mycena latifolia]|nr:NADP-dependent oxidoreductase domain-containing protein [Mycena latifolia]
MAAPQTQWAPRIPVIYGTGGIGSAGTFCKLGDARAAQTVFDAWLARCGPSAVDSSNLHGFGTGEKILAEMNLGGSVVDTKIYPWAPGHHGAAKLRAAVDQSIERLRGLKIRVLYLHAPDRATPWTETLETIDALYKEGKFEMFGLSNYKAFEVAEIATLCRVHGWVAPTVYQGLYNALDRTVEVDLFPCLRHFNIRFAAYSPMAGGYLVGHLLPASPSTRPVSPATPALTLEPTHPVIIKPALSADAYTPAAETETETERARKKIKLDAVNGAPAPMGGNLNVVRAQTEIKIPHGSHFDPSNPFGVWYQERYLPMGAAARELRDVLESHNITLHSAAVRWLQHHSLMQPTDLGIVFGGSRAAHVEGTLGYCTDGPLPAAAVEAINACYAKVRGGLPHYAHDPAWYNPAVYGY